MLDNSKVIRNKEIIILEKKREETNTQEKEINLSSTTLDTFFDDIFKNTFASFECQVIRNKLEIIILEKKGKKRILKKKKSTCHQQRWILFSTIFLRIRLHRSNAK